MSIFDKVAKWLNDDSSKIEVVENRVKVSTEYDTPDIDEDLVLQDEDDGLQVQSPECNNIIDKSSALLDSIIKMLRSNYKGSKIDFSQRSLILWVDEAIFFDVLSEDDFVSDLKQKLNDQLGFCFKEVLLKNDEIPQKATLVMQNVGVTVASAVINTSVIKTAILSSIEDCGSLVSNPILLDSNAIQDLPDKRYNIGVSAVVRMANGLVRVNQIAIDDDATSSQYDKNKFVSRAHAYITFHEEYGFLLYVEPGGTRNSGKRTHVCRDGKMTEWNNPHIPMPLQDKDIIVLSRNVMLKFEAKK